MKKTLHHSELILGEQLNSFLRKLESLPLPERRLKLRQQPNPYTRFLYKYRPLEKPGHIDWLRDYLIDSKLWLSSPTFFNDPFDMTCHVVFDGRPQDKRKRILELLKKHASWMNEVQRDRISSELMASNEELLKNVRLAHEKQTREVGVFSLTADPRNILMWSHYGSNHQGVCLQFEVAKDVRVFSRAISVDYDECYPTVNWADDAVSQVRKMLTKKHNGWRYEKERRIIVPNEAGKYLAFSPAALKGIILGCQIKNESKAEIRKLLEERNANGLPEIKVYEAKRHSQRFMLRLSKVEF